MENRESMQSKGLSRRDFLAGAGAALGAAGIAGLTGRASAFADEAEDEAAAEEEIAVEEETADSADSADAEGELQIYTGSGEGRKGDIMVKVGISGTTLESIEVIKQHETPQIANSAISRIPQLMIKNQTVNVDAVTGATITSYGIIAAVKDALDQAGLSDDDLAHTGEDDGVVAETPIDADIAVIGGGLTGLVATVRALENGQKVVLFEETAHVGGSCCVSDGWVTGADTIMEQQEGIEDSVDQFYAFLASDESAVPYPDITYKFAETAGTVLDWLDTYVNVDFGDREGGYGLYVAPDVPRIYGVNNGGGSMVLSLVELIQDGIAEGNCSVILEARATSILKDDAGAVSGVEITYNNGNVLDYPCKAVILATGGYSNNEDMMPYANCGACSPSTASGHGWDLAATADAKTYDIAAYAPYAGGIRNEGFEMRYQANMSLPGEIWVNLEGTRMANEDNALLAKSAWGLATDNIGYVVFSENQLYSGCRPIVLTSYLEGELTPWESMDLLDELIEDGQVAWKADSAEELAELAGIDAAFATTISDYNSYVDAGEDPDFGREDLEKLEGTLYAIKTVPYQLQCSGGVLITVDAEVYGSDDEVIPGLYAGGEAIGMRQACGGSQGGCGLGNAYTWGYIAADSACAYVG